MAPVKTQWFNDRHAEHVYRQMREALSDIITRLCPNHELSHFGVLRDDATEEVILKLHLNPVCRIKIIPGGSNETPPLHRALRRPD